jgi:hypothetical protein
MRTQRYIEEVALRSRLGLADRVMVSQINFTSYFSGILPTVSYVTREKSIESIPSLQASKRNDNLSWAALLRRAVSNDIKHNNETSEAVLYMLTTHSNVNRLRESRSGLNLLFSRRVTAVQLDQDLTSARHLMQVRSCHVRASTHRPDDSTTSEGATWI